jgi:hypothetical protein
MGLMARKSAKGIREDSFMTQAVGDMEIEPAEEFCPLYLLLIEVLGSHEVLQVLIVCLTS